VGKSGKRYDDWVGGKEEGRSREIREEDVTEFGKGKKKGNWGGRCDWVRERRREEVGKLGRKMWLSAGKEKGKRREIGEEDVTECGKGGGKK
jgi:hypothetical protein